VCVCIARLHAAIHSLKTQFVSVFGVCVCVARLHAAIHCFMAQFVSVLGVCDMRGSMIHCFFRDWERVGVFMS
jgi:hypothetical protein